ncbi:hypothetical protein [Streptacidiphilus sp. P02-A3a]|uniref:hypothetical protein n=1 Tax=Streptacidiphilus sp. P02-A3a TaxID=2704468 RepID=UPI0015FBA989|nr:hypothetical protein [Streptacidiphilus sp. P02-A3a]QMU70494.1 hypothetical protein GXP74_22110 [Streptacidiphilus sp. P02-A3a]
MGASTLYQVGNALPNASSALACARQLLTRFGTGAARAEFAFNDIATSEQFHYARRYFSHGTFMGDERYLNAPGYREFWQTLARWGFEEKYEGLWVETDLQPQLAALWPLPEGVQFQLLSGSTPRTFPLRSGDDLTAPEMDIAVAAVGPLTVDINWYSSLLGLPAPKLCGVQLCLNGVWTVQCSEPAPGAHAVYLSIGTQNSEEIAERWLHETGLDVGEGLAGW